MKLLVISDSHKADNTVEDIICRHPDIKHIFFLGDNTADIENLEFLYDDKNFYIVSGNCDYICEYSLYGIEKISGHNIFYTHGHTYCVKEGLSQLSGVAQNCGCDIVLYGHTHISDITYKDGMYFVNPGSCRKSRNGINSYAVIEICEKGVIPSIIPI